MDIKSFINKREFEKINIRLNGIKNELSNNSFNLFTISSYNTYLENFHSDVIGILLDPNERHNKNSTFLNIFLDYLVSLGAALKLEDFSLCEITRELGRIDIWIKDNTSKKSIIIENKINNAGDQENQLENYYNYALESGFEVNAILYITLNGKKAAPLTDNQDLNNKVINISASTNRNFDLCNGWLLKCYTASTDEDNRSFIFQYLKLIKHLSQTGMDKEIKDNFYSVINTDDGYEKAIAISQLVSGLEEYRADLFAARVNNDYLPFKKIYRWRPNHWLFENYNDNGIIFKLDVYFNSKGDARMDFWNPNQPENIQEGNTSNKLRSIGLLDEFQFGGFGGGKFKVFTIDEYKNIKTIDEQLFNFVKQLFEKLRSN